MAVLEKLFERMDAKLDRITDAVEGLRLEIAGVDARLGREIAELKGSVASVSQVAGLTSEVAELRGSLRHLPTAWMLVTTVLGSAVVVIGGIFTALRYTGHG